VIFHRGHWCLYCRININSSVEAHKALPARGQARLAYRPSKKSIKRIVERVHALTDRARSWQETRELIDMLNRALRG
jgi:hypothetical protein